MGAKCVVCKKNPARSGMTMYTFLCEPCYTDMNRTSEFQISWAASRARRFERKRWWHLRPGAKP